MKTNHANQSTENANADSNQDNIQQESPELGIQRIYVKDLSVEVPHSPSIFLEQWEPQVQLDLNDEFQHLNKNIYEVTLLVTVKAKLKNEKVAFLVELKLGGIFAISGFPDDQLGPLLGAYCPNILYPYAREVISDAVARAGFPQLYLAPVNFDAVYQQRQQIRNQRPETESGMARGEQSANN